MTVFEKATGDLSQYGMVQYQHCYHHKQIGEFDYKSCAKDPTHPQRNGEAWRRCDDFTQNPATAHLRQRAART